MIKVIRWIVLIWTILVIPYLFDGDFPTVFFSLVYAALIIGLMIKDLKNEKKKSNT